MVKIFACGAQPLIMINFICGKNINLEGGGGGMGGKNVNFKFNIYPCSLVLLCSNKVPIHSFIPDKRILVDLVKQRQLTLELLYDRLTDWLWLKVPNYGRVMYL